MGFARSRQRLIQTVDVRTNSPDVRFPCLGGYDVLCPDAYAYGSVSRFRKIGQGDEWKDCSPEAIRWQKRGEQDEQATATESHSGIQGESGIGSAAGR